MISTGNAFYLRKRLYYLGMLVRPALMAAKDIWIYVMKKYRQKRRGNALMNRTWGEQVKKRGNNGRWRRWPYYL
jgi:hypothetical protein